MYKKTLITSDSFEHGKRYLSQDFDTIRKFFSLPFIGKKYLYRHL